MTKKVRYRSGLEQKLGNTVFKDLKYEPFKLEYPVEKISTYTPDFVDEKKKILYEAKGYFRIRSDATKYTYIVPAMEKLGWRFIFIFEKPHTAMPGVRVRKNGTKQSMAEWADLNGFEWYPMMTIPRSLLV